MAGAAEVGCQSHYTGSRDHESRKSERSIAASPRRYNVKTEQSSGAPQAPPGYLDFAVWIDQKSEALYRAKAWSGAAGFEATECFALPAGLAGGELCLAGGGARRGGSGTAEAVDGAGPEQVGDELFRAVFQ